MSKKKDMTYEQCIKVLKRHSRNVKRAIKESEEIQKSEDVITTSIGTTMINEMKELRDALLLAIAELND